MSDHDETGGEEPQVALTVSAEAERLHTALVAYIHATSEFRAAILAFNEAAERNKETPIAFDLNANEWLDKSKGVEDEYEGMRAMITDAVMAAQKEDESPTTESLSRLGFGAPFTALWCRQWKRCAWTWHCTWLPM